MSSIHAEKLYPLFRAASKNLSFFKISPIDVIGTFEPIVTKFSRISFKTIGNEKYAMNNVKFYSPLPTLKFLNTYISVYI